MQFKSLAIVSAVASFGLMANLAHADFDARPYISNNQIVTGGHDDENNIDTAVQRVFTYDFGDVAADPYNIGDPGFNTNGQSAFTPTSTLNFRGLSLTGGLSIQYWDGTGSPQFGAVPSGVSINLSGSPSRYISYSSSGISYAGGTPLTIGNFSATNGALHVHLGTSIFENGAQADNSVPTGEYLISYQLENPSTGVINSDPLFIVYNNGLSDEQTDAAATYVNATYTPEPASLGVLGLGATLLLRRRK